MLTHTDQDGHTTTNVYDPANGNLLTSTDAMSNTTLYVWAGAGDVGVNYGLGDLKSVTGTSRGNMTKYLSYDVYGDPTQIFVPTQGASGITTNQTFDAGGRLLVTIDTYWHHEEFGYDGLDRRIRETQFDDQNPANNKFQLPGDGAGAPWAQETLYQYLPGGQLEQVTNGLGQVTIYTYDSGNRLIMTDERSDGTHPDVITAYTYDQDGNVVTMTDPGGGIETVYVTDALNRITQTTILAMTQAPSDGINADHVILKTTYDLLGNVTSQTDQHNNTTFFSYDGLYRLVVTQLPVAGLNGPAVARIAYDSVGNKVLQTDNNGKPTTYSYDADNRLLVTTDALGNKVLYQYDANGNVIKETHTSPESPGGADVVTYVVAYPENKIDGLNRPTEMDQTVFLGDPMAGTTAQVTYVTTTIYDDPHNRIVTINPRGNDPTDHVSGTYGGNSSRRARPRLSADARRGRSKSHHDLRL